jgi:hypothetical protein
MICLLGEARRDMLEEIRNDKRVTVSRAEGCCTRCTTQGDSQTCHGARDGLWCCRWAMVLQMGYGAADGWAMVPQMDGLWCCRWMGYGAADGRWRMAHRMRSQSRLRSAYQRTYALGDGGIDFQGLYISFDVHSLNMIFRVLFKYEHPTHVITA